MAARPWFDDIAHRVELMARISSTWYVVDATGRTGKVTDLWYKGYLVDHEDGTTSILHPDLLTDLTTEEYTQRRVVSTPARVVVPVVSVATVGSPCFHKDTKTETVIRAAGCDIDDTTCVACHQLLRRQWSTAYDRDPDDHISDWPWFVRYCKKEYKGWEPSRTDYVVVDRIGHL